MPRIFVQRIVIPFLLIALSGAPAAGWGKTGHRVVARIAAAHLSDVAALEVNRLLGPGGLVRASTWADFVRSDPAWQHAEPWHYLDLAAGETLATTVRDPAGDILEALERFATRLAAPGTELGERQVALRFLVHLVGDLHQPLHLGRREDRGGNDLAVTWFGEPSNLHVVWDSKMIDLERFSFSEYAELLDHPSVAEIRAWQATSYRAWAEESLELSAAVYEVGDGELGWPYVYRHLPVLERRLVQAGVRLAGVLNAIFATPSPR